MLTHVESYILNVSYDFKHFSNLYLRVRCTFLFQINEIKRIPVGESTTQYVIESANTPFEDLTSIGIELTSAVGIKIDSIYVIGCYKLPGKTIL